MTESARQTILDYNMLRPGDKVLIALSGGKDSLTLLHILNWLRADPQFNFELCAVHIETDASCGTGIFGGLLQGLCGELGVPIQHIYFPIIEDAGEQLSCFYCAMRRRAAMFNHASSNGFTVLAFGHHLSDMAETLLMNMSFHGNISTMTPAAEFFDGKLRIIRPLARVGESQTREFIHTMGLATAVCTCPFSSENIRSEFKKYIIETESEAPGLQTRLFQAMSDLGGGTRK